MTSISRKKRPPNVLDADSDVAATLLPTNKKLKLDSLFEGLSLKDDKSKVSPSIVRSTSQEVKGNPVLEPLVDEVPFVKDKKPSTNTFVEIKTKKINGIEVNPNINVGKYSVFKTSSSSSTTSPSTSANIDAYVSEKLMEHFQNVINSSNKVIKWYQPYIVLAYDFQKWALRLFNRFLKKYNTRVRQENPEAGPENYYKPFKFFFKITNLINNPDTNFTFQDLMNILLQESEIEILRVRRRREDKLKMSSEIDLELRDIKYNYWDRVPDLSKDLEMSDDINDRFVDLGDVDSNDMDYDMNPVDMNESTSHNLMESNYGLYYYDYKSHPKDHDESMTDDIMI